MGDRGGHGGRGHCVRKGLGGRCKCCKSRTCDSGINPGFFLLYSFLLFYPSRGAGHHHGKDAFFSDLETLVA